MIKETIVRRIIQEEIKKLQEEPKEKSSKESELKNITVQIFFRKELGVTDIMVQIRTLLGINTTYSLMKTKVSKMGRKVIVLRLSYDPMGVGNKNYIEQLIKDIRNIKGVVVAKLISSGDDRLTKQIDNAIGQPQIQMTGLKDAQPNS